MSGVFFYSATLAFILGVGVSSTYDFTPVTISFLFLVTGIFIFLWRVTKATSHKHLYLFLLCFSLGVFHMDTVASRLSELAPYEGRRIELIGSVAREPEERNTLVYLTVDPHGEGAHELVLVSSDRAAIREQSIAYGDIIRVTGVLKEPESFESNGGRVFAYGGYLRAQGVYYTLPFGDVTRIREGNMSIPRILFHIKKRFTETLEKHIPEPEVGLGKGVLLGVRGALGDTLETKFREVGLIHIVVLSGYNIMVVVSLLTAVCLRFLYPRTRLIVGSAAIVLFAIMVGLSATVVRATIMALCVLFAESTGRRYAVVRALMFACILMLLHNPYLLVYDPGFQLSFIATLGLILLTPHIEAKLVRITERFKLRSLVATTIAAQISVLPLLLYTSGTVSLFTLPANIAVLPLVPIAMIFVFLTGVSGMVAAPLGIICGYGAYLLLGYIIAVADFLGGVQFAIFRIDAFPFWIVILAYGALAFLIWRMKSEEIKETVFITDVTDEFTEDFDTWEIVEEHEAMTGIEKSPRETQSVSRGDFPFR